MPCRNKSNVVNSIYEDRVQVLPAVPYVIELQKKYQSAKEGV